MNQNASTDSSVSMSFGAPAEEISRRAYEIWENEGRPEGCDQRHWLQAEQELSEHTRNAGAPVRSTNTGADVRPLQGTRAAAAANREPRRGSNSPFGNSQNAGKRKSSSAPVL